MRVQIVLLSGFLSILQILTLENAQAFGRGNLNSCAALFPSGSGRPILFSSLNRLLGQSQGGSPRAKASLEEIGVESDFIRKFQMRTEAYGPKLEIALRSFESIAEQSNSVVSSLRGTYFQVARLWLELWISQPTQFQNLQHLQTFPSRLASMFALKAGSFHQLLIRKQRLDGFADLLLTLKNDIQYAGTGGLSLRELTSLTLANPNPKRALSAMEKKLLALSESRREEFLKSCLP